MIVYLALCASFTAGFLMRGMFGPRETEQPIQPTRDGYWRIKFEEECG